MKTTRIEVKKTFKLYINGSFPRSESGRYVKLKDGNGELIANVCRGSKKDFRDAVVAARKAQAGWSARSAYNTGQILYRIAETLEGRKAQFIETLRLQGMLATKAENEVHESIDTFVYYAGWSDKYRQVYSSVNPVESSHFNFSFPEPTGVVSLFAPAGAGLLAMTALLAPAITGGNTVILFPGEKYPLAAIELAEVLHASDLPAGVVNIITGLTKELLSSFSNHMDVNAVVYAGDDSEQLKITGTNAALNVKRVVHYSGKELTGEGFRNPYRILDLQEIKTTWHPVGK